GLHNASLWSSTHHAPRTTKSATHHEVSHAPRSQPRTTKSATNPLPTPELTGAGKEQDLAVADPAGPGLPDDGLDRQRCQRFLDEDAQLNLGHERRVVLAAQVL